MPIQDDILAANLTLLAGFGVDEMENNDGDTLEYLACEIVCKYL